ncbi:uncharacterized protein LOC143022614 isoform X1 [Oratosquilla oratoria]|uniref:uncharacterized protein LOC143022614 isoform X1 n=1 Tax=Oratosquilla oratoria TaxID=337810 RepID=UPI003F76A377
MQSPLRRNNNNNHAQLLKMQLQKQQNSRMKPLRPGDLFLCSLSTTQIISSLENSICDNIGISLTSTSGINPSGSLVNTELKKSASTVAFTLSSLVFEFLFKSLYRLHILTEAFVLDWTYFQNIFGLDLTFCAIVFSTFLTEDLVSALT